VSRISFCTLLVLTMMGSPLWAQGEPTAKNSPAASLAPSPAAFLGYELGSRYTEHARVVAYVRELARKSDRVQLVDYGRSSQGRELVLAFVSAPEHIENLEGLRLSMAKIADPRRQEEGESTAALIESQPAFLWLSYCVHGNETSCTEAALAVLHRLATSKDEAIVKQLSQAVVIIDPCVNPDGRDRYVNWFNAVVGSKADPHPQSMEHREPWPGGRYNHYGFDLNRDWAFASQVETRARHLQFRRWNPQVHGDFHEMGYESSYFFFPADDPVNANLPPHTMKWGKIFGRGNAQAFDAQGWRYYTAESFDLFYPGYGDSWPSFTGAIGMTYEQAGHGRSGLAIKRRDGHVLTLAERIAHHDVASMATIATAANNREELLADYAQFRSSAIEEGRGGAIREFVLTPGHDPDRTARLVDLLLLQGIEVRRAQADFSVSSAVDYQGNKAERRFAAGTFLVSLAQPLKRLAKTLLEPRTEIKELYFYDVSAWSLPYAFGVEAYWSPSAIEVEAESITAAPRVVGKVEEGESTCGFLLPWDRMASVRAALEFMERGVEVRSAGKGFTLGGRAWQPGTLFVPRGGNVEGLDQVVAEVAAATGAQVHPAATGMTEKGIDLGSDQVRRLRTAKIALLGGEGTSSTSFGASRFFLEEVHAMPHSIFPIDALGGLDLEGYSAIVIPNAFRRFDDDDLEALRAFLREGGVVVAWGSTARALGAEGAKLSRISMKSKSKKGEEAAKKETKRPKKIKEREEEDRKASAPGSIFRVELDPAHPLAFGYGSEIAVFKSGTSTFDPLSGTAVGVFRDAPRLSGYLNDENDQKMRGRGYAMVQRMGRGSIVFFAEDPNFRSAWHGLSRLLLNALLLLPRN
jgi:Zinc carboxypeptidase